MTDTFINPITTSFDLLQSYRHLFIQNRENAGLAEQNNQQIFTNMEVDGDLFLFIGREYQGGKSSFRQFGIPGHAAVHLTQYIHRNIDTLVDLALALIIHHAHPADLHGIGHVSAAISLQV